MNEKDEVILNGIPSLIQLCMLREKLSCNLGMFSDDRGNCTFSKKKKIDYPNDLELE